MTRLIGLSNEPRRCDVIVCTQHKYPRCANYITLSCLCANSAETTIQQKIRSGCFSLSVVGWEVGGRICVNAQLCTEGVVVVVVLLQRKRILIVTLIREYTTTQPQVNASTSTTTSPDHQHHYRENFKVANPPRMPNYCRWIFYRIRREWKLGSGLDRNRWLIFKTGGFTVWLSAKIKENYLHRMISIDSDSFSKTDLYLQFNVSVRNQGGHAS